VQHAIAGIAIGLPAAFLLSRVMSSMVFGVTTHDPLTFTALPILIVAVTSVGVLPTRAPARASIRCRDQTGLNQLYRCRAERTACAEERVQFAHATSSAAP
jgi:hypothetical protein